MNKEGQDLFPGATDTMARTAVTVLIYFSALFIPLLVVFRDWRAANPVYELEIMMHAFSSIWALPFAAGLPLLFVAMVWWDLSRFHGFCWTIISQCVCISAYEEIGSYANKWILIGAPILLYFCLLWGLLFMNKNRQPT